MFSFQELGAIIRLIFVYRFNFSKMNLASKTKKEIEAKKDIYTGVIFILIIIFTAFIRYFYS